MHRRDMGGSDDFRVIGCFGRKKGARWLKVTFFGTRTHCRQWPNTHIYKHRRDTVVDDVAAVRIRRRRRVARKRRAAGGINNNKVVQGWSRLKISALIPILYNVRRLKTHAFKLHFTWTIIMESDQSNKMFRFCKVICASGHVSKFVLRLSE